MRQAMLMYVILMPAIAVSTSGDAAAADESTEPTRQAALLDPVFDCFHANSAWGFSLSGKAIDGSGKIWSYSMRGQTWLPTTVKEGAAVYLTAADLQAKFAQSKQDGSVDAKVLAENSALIALAAQGSIARTDTGTRDAGTSTCHAYIHDEAHQRYRDIELGSDGGVSDTRDTNSSPQAQVLLTWLEFVGVAN